MSMDQTSINRSGYTILDLLSDMGGLQGILITGISLILSILNNNYLENYLVSKLFKFEAATLTTSNKENCKDTCLYSCLPNKLVCSSKNRK